MKTYDCCPKCGWAVEYGCGCPDGRPTFPLVRKSPGDPMPDADATALEGLLKAATPGPWVEDLDDRPGMGWNIHICAGELVYHRIAFMAVGVGSIPDAALIVGAVNALPRLLSDRARMREALERIAREDCTLAWTGGTEPVPSHNEFGPFSEIACAALAPAGEGK